MKILFDTSVLVAAMIESHPAHERALPYLEQIKNGNDIGIISAHTLAELYAVLTSFPIRPQIAPAQVKRLLNENIIGTFEILALTDSDYKNLIEQLVELGISGGTTYDGIHMRAASNANVDQILTLNPKAFRRVFPSLADKIITP